MRFLERWARRKSTVQAGLDDEAPWRQRWAELPPDGDVTPFLAPEVPEDIRQAAMRRLFATGQFGVPDGLDSEYVDVNAQPTLSPEEVLSLAQWQSVTAPLRAPEEASPAEGVAMPPQEEAAAAHANASHEGALSAVTMPADYSESAGGAQNPTTLAAEVPPTEAAGERSVPAYRFVVKT